MVLLLHGSKGLKFRGMNVPWSKGSGHKVSEEKQFYLWNSAYSYGKVSNFALIFVANMLDFTEILRKIICIVLDKNPHYYCHCPLF